MDNNKNNSKQNKITNLFEDGNVHVHDQKSYEKMMEHSNQNSKDNSDYIKNNRKINNK